MARLRFAAAAAAALVLVAPVARAQTVKVGLIGSFSGPFVIFGKNFKAGVETFVAQNGDKSGGHVVELIYRDLPEANPAQAKAIAQELIVKDGVQYIAGVVFTPDALAIAPLLEESQVAFVIFNAAGSIITTKSPYIVRTSFSLAQNSAPMGKAAIERGIKKVTTAVTDYGPGLDSEAAFTRTLEAGGGQVVESIRMPLKTTDYAPFMQRIKDSGAEAVFTFLPAGPPAIAFAKAFIENGLKDQGIRLLTTGDLTEEPDLPGLGDAGLGILSTFHYSKAHESAANKTYLAKAKEVVGSLDDITFQSVAAYDGMHVIYAMIAATDGKRDPAKAVDAVRGLAWESPRGPVMIDPETRHITQTIYLRVVDKDASGQYINREIASYPRQGDPGLPGK